MAARKTPEKSVSIKDIEQAIRTSKKHRAAVIKLITADFSKELVKSLDIVAKLKSRLR